MTLLDVPISYVVIAWAVVFIGSVIQGSVGFGMAVLSAPVLLLIAPVFVPGSLIAAAMALCLMIAFRERASIVYEEVAVSSIARVVATIPTVLMLKSIDSRAFSVVFAISVLVAVAISFSGYALPFNRANLAVASGLSGITSTITSIGGPPMALIYQRQRGPHLRATMSAIFAVGTVISIACLAAVGRFGLHDLALGLMLMPSIAAGFAVSRYTTPWLDARATRPAVLGVAAFSAVVILAKAFWGE